MKKICNYRIMVFCFLSMLFSIATLLISNYNRVYAILLFSLIVASFFILLFKRKLLRFIFIPLFMLIGFVASTMYGQVILSRQVTAQNVLVTGRVKEVRLYGVVIEDVKLSTVDIKGDVLVYTDKELAIGDNISTRTNIKPIEYKYDDAFINSLYDKNIYHMVDGKEIKVTSTSKLTVSETIKEKTKHIYSNIREDSASIAYGMIFGDTSFINYDIKGTINRTGLNHIFAVSGLHIGFLAALIMWINKKLKIKRLFNVVLTVFWLILYNILCGYSPSMVRATLMMLIVLIGNEYGEKNDGITRLAFAGLLILLVKPYSLFTISFELSFLAVFGLIAFSANFDKIFGKNKNKITGILSASLAVNFAIFPLVCYHFKTFPFLFLPVNLLILPILPIIYSLTMIFTIVNLIIPSVNFIIVLDYILIPIKLASLITDVVAVSLLNITFTKVLTAFYLGAEIIVTPYIFINKNYKISLFFLLTSLGLIFTLIQL